MATTKLWHIQGRLKDLVDYVENPEKTVKPGLQDFFNVFSYTQNPDKTAGGQFVTAINCQKDIALQQMILTKQRYGKEDGYIAWHGYQSFKPGEVTPEQCHALGEELARQMWGDRFQVIVTTHLDKEHLHNHFCINSVSFKDGGKYNFSKKELNRLRDTSDRLCREYGLSVVEQPHKAPSRQVWLDEQAGKPTRYNIYREDVQKAIDSPFARADLQNMLVMLDDDMKMEALTQTNNIKAIVTAELPMDLERKGQQSYQADMRVRFLALGNGRMQALHDRSYGFFRRQILLEAKEQSPDRRDDPYLAQRLCAEKEGIFLWAFAGLQRLVANDFHFTLSQLAKENMETAIAEGNNLVEFMKSEGYFLFQADSEVSSRDFYAVYLQWCVDNALSPLAQKTVINYLKQNSRQYNLEYTNKISIDDGRFVRGFWGIQLLKK